MAKIMVVDDEPGVVYVMKRFLEKTGHVVVSASNGVACLERVGGEKPDLVLLDIMMPGIDGWEVCKRIKNDPATNSISVIMFSVLSDSVAREKSVNYCGADAHFSKTVDLKEVVDRVQTILNKKA